MKKRALLGISTLLAAAVVPAASVFAADDVLDYANSIGSWEGSDTINYVVEATTDGGYVVGGQAMKCLRIDWALINTDDEEYGGSVDEANGMVGSAQTTDAPIWELYPDAIEQVAMSECVEHLGAGDSEVRTLAAGAPYGGDSFCLSNSSEPNPPANVYEEPVGGVMAEEHDYGYGLMCTDYIAKFKKDGTKEWQTIIDDNSVPIAVGETTSDYRLITERGTIYTFSKGGEEGLSNNFADYRLRSAIVNEDGSYIVSRNGDGIDRYSKNGQLEKSIMDIGEDEEIWLYNRYHPMIESNDSIFIYGDMKDSETGDWKPAIYEVSKDLETVTIRVDRSEAGVEPPYLIAANDDGTILVEEGCVWDDQTETVSGCKDVLYDTNGDVIKELPDNTLSAFGDYHFFGMDIVFDEDAGVVYYLNEDFEPIAQYELGDGEYLFDFAKLNDSSIVTVGFSDTSSDNYEVEGAQNGVQMRFILAEAEGDDEPVTPAEEPKNPSTLDNAQIFAISGAVVLMGAALLTKKMLARR